MNLDDFANISFDNPIIIDDTPPNEEEVIDNPIDDTSATEVNTEVDTGLESSSTEEEWEFTDEAAPELLNTLAQLGHIVDLPEGIDPEAIGAEEAKTILAYRDKQLSTKAANEAAEYERKRIISKLSPTLQKAMSYNISNPNAEDSEILGFLGSIGNVNRITQLDPEKDAETIVREYLKTQELTAAEINEEVSDLIERDKLSTRAASYKPKLDIKAQAIVKKQEDEARQIQQFENQRQTELHTNTTNLLTPGNIGGIPLDRETQQFVYSAVMNNEVPVTIKGRQVEMDYLSALVMHNKYSGKPEDLEKVAFAALVLKDGIEGFKKHLAKQVTTKETEKAVKQFKFTNKKKTSVQTPKEKENDGGFQINF